MNYKPLKFFVIYITFTLLVSFWGPVEYLNYKKIPVAVYISFFLILFSIGYFFGINKIKRKKNGYIIFNKHDSIIKIVKLLIVITITLQLLDMIEYISTNGLHLKSVGAAYIDIYSQYERNVAKSYSVIDLIRFGTGIIEFVTLTLGIYYYKDLGKKYRILLGLIIIVYLFSTLILQGKQKQLGDLIIIVASIILLKLKIRKTLNFKKMLGIFSVLLIAIITFTYVQKSRFEAMGVNAFNYNSVSQAQISINTDHPFFSMFGYDWGFPLSLLLSGYLSGGYYGLSLSLQLPFEWTYGLSSSYVWSVISSRFLHLPNMYEMGYVFRMENEFGWPALSKWHTIFPWLASDFTFPGAILILAVIAYIYAICWSEAYLYKNPFSVLMFTLLNVLLFFVPANNQLMMGIEQFFLTIALFVIWLNRHRIFKKIL